MIKWIEPETFQGKPIEWKYEYDGVGNITNITDALGGHYVMAYGPRNERILERNQDGKNWSYEYDELLRLKQQTDPNGTVRTVVYDRGGRIDYVLLNTGRTDDHQYDANNNLRLLSRSRAGEAPTITTFAYDIQDRLTESTDAFDQTVRFGYDALGRRTTLTYPDGKTLLYRYDALSRLTNQVFQFDAQRSFPLTYEYDRADRLIRRTYPNGIVQSNAFDNAGRITSLSYSTFSLQPSAFSL